MPVIMTPRLILRSWREEDARALFLIARDKRVGMSAGWKPHSSVKESLSVINDVFSAPEVYALVLRESGEIIGSAGLMTEYNSDIGLCRGDCEIGYWLGVPYWGQGYCTEAAKALISRAFTELSMQRIFCNYFEGNYSSARVAQKCGFTPHSIRKNVYYDAVGGARNEYVTCMTRQDWLFRKLKNNKKT